MYRHQPKLASYIGSPKRAEKTFLGYAPIQTRGDNDMSKRICLLIGASLCLALSLGCGVEEDDDMMMNPESSMDANGTDAEEQGPEIGGDCSCEEGESICQGGCPTGLTCAALSCTVSCDEDRPCPAGSSCTAISAQDFDEDDTTNFGLSYCF